MRFTPNPRYRVAAITPEDRQEALYGLLAAVTRHMDSWAQRQGCKTAIDYQSWAAHAAHQQ